ncbi:MAG TPA: type VI secretion system tip protein TssI/VgrG [Acetobacteraceae bacterium]|nr:type VI secretion system tip protein TssI/VgrG [Acetobacteraceae bacterium]
MMDDTHASDGYAQKDRLFAIDTPLGPDTALLTTLEGEDVLSRCFEYRVTIETEQSDSAVQTLLGMPVTLWLYNDNTELRRPVHGHVRRLTGQGVTARGAGRYQLEVVPRLWFLTCTSDCRIFQNQSIPDIVQTIFTEQGLVDFEFRVVRADYPPVEYCVQYQETAFNFVSRLLEHLGLFYWHEHSADRHLLVIADRNDAAGWCQPRQVTMSPLSGVGELQSLNLDCTFRPGRWALNDYDFESPTRLLRVDAPTTLTVPRMANHEMYEYPGKFLDQDTGKRLSRLRIEMEEAHQRRVLGTGRCAGFDPGRRFTVGAARGGRPTTYLLTEVRHHGTAPGGEADGAEANYTNDFVAIPVDLPFRPERLTPKPFVHSAQTATVVGPPGESIFCDPYGRVRVQFHWDRRGQRNHQSSCWMRVAQTRAGSFYGSQVIPHVGHEVIVSFLEGDPDRPLITGSVPNALTMPPMELPADKHKTIQRDHGDNKLVMNGKPGGERMSMISPRAVNLFASGPSARPLSSYATVKPPPATSGSTLPFYSDPQSYTLTTIPGGQTQGSVASGQTATTANIPTYKDAEGLTELWNEWYGTTQSDIDNSSPITDPSTAAGNAGSYGTQDGTAADSYLNWGSQGRINCLTLGNNNLWVNLDNNAWINGSVNTQINGDSTTVIGGTKYQPNGPLTNPSTATTTVWGANISEVMGDNTSTVLGSNNSFVGVNNTSVTVGLNVSTVIGENFSLNIGGINTVNIGLWNTTTTVGADAKTYLGLKLDDSSAKMSTALTEMKTALTHMRDAAASINNMDILMNTATTKLVDAVAAIYL